MNQRDDEVRDLLSEAAERSTRYLEGVANRRVYPRDDAIANLSKLGGALPEAPTDPGEVLKLLDEFGSPGTVATTGGRYFGFVVGGALPVTVASHWLSDAWDQNASLHVMSPVAACLEDICLPWLLELLALPSTTGGAFVTGAQMANFTCLAAARHAVLARAGWDVESDGLFGAPEITVVVSDEVHATVLKALALLGLGRDRIVRVPVDDQGRMKVEDIPRLETPSIVCTQAGNVNTGSFDPVGQIHQKVHGTGTWIHVDGAFGLWARSASGRRHLAAGLEEADSWATDAHKWLNVPQDSGLAFVREPEQLRRAMWITASYLAPGDRREPMQHGPESSRRARGVEVWAALRTLGRQGVEDLIERTCNHARTFADRLECAGHEILNEVSLNQVLVSFGSDEVTRDVVHSVQADGVCWCGATRWRGRTAMRISVSSWATTGFDVELSLASILESAARVTAGSP